jgi:hypothetical protein
MRVREGALPVQNGGALLNPVVTERPRTAAVESGLQRINQAQCPGVNGLAATPGARQFHDGLVLLRG